MTREQIIKWQQEAYKTAIQNNKITKDKLYSDYIMDIITEILEAYKAKDKPFATMEKFSSLLTNLNKEKPLTPEASPGLSRVVYRRATSD